MISVKTRTHIGLDGTLTLEVPTPLRETDVEVVLVVQALIASQPRLDNTRELSRVPAILLEDWEV